MTLLAQFSSQGVEDGINNDESTCATDAGGAMKKNWSRVLVVVDDIGRFFRICHGSIDSIDQPQEAVCRIGNIYVWPRDVL